MSQPNTISVGGAGAALKTPVADQAYAQIGARMQFYVDQNILSSCETLLLQGNQIVDHQCFGYMDLESKRPLQTDAIYRMYSNTKLITSVALMMLHERGLFKLDDAVAEYIPKFADPKVLRADAKSAKDVESAHSQITMAQALSHSAGWSYGFIEPESVVDSIYNSSNVNILQQFDITLEQLVDELATFPLAYQPGTSWRYSLATDVCARLIEVLSGQRFDEFLQANIFTPLKMHDTDFWVPPEKQDRFIHMYAPVDLLDPMKSGLVKADDPHTGQYSQPRGLLSGGGGLASTVADYATFICMITNGGELDGVRILKPETLDLMRTNQLADGVGVSFPMWAMPGTVFGLGFALKQTVSADEPEASRNEYHWGGMAGTHSWMAPEAGITGMCLTQRMPGFWHPFSHEFKNLAYGAQT